MSFQGCRILAGSFEIYLKTEKSPFHFNYTHSCPAWLFWFLVFPVLCLAEVCFWRWYMCTCTCSRSASPPSSYHVLVSTEVALISIQCWVVNIKDQIRKGHHPLYYYSGVFFFFILLCFVQVCLFVFSSNFHFCFLFVCLCVFFFFFFFFFFKFTNNFLN